ncbi:hypothetical protein P153DRAFT_50529 [Dothidotthia symphoricarpi CBS 119687]|uniref:Uncharacterized protein n=1 Tax=Dothidotthia symphoricarpi CBS 119687 TaxID=1392245 RepID=A0A6A6A6G6_9PLEO|nr:uncharacterized protein P153DRAFT_50529 [Dothidotthia symphoricarpi CBS 119687]KAF2127479.1 hypothetical protein P153DRAFT_50529 [Dothidotthia symphoricarpi CBS 119687]
MTGLCIREGFIPQMFGSITILMASKSQLDSFAHNGIQCGVFGHGGTFRHAGLSAEEVANIVLNEFYAGLRDKNGQEVVYQNWLK